jgi:hypothetical protein
MDELTSISLKYNTDKSYFHNFTLFYYEFFKSKKYDKMNILEIGILNGSSLKILSEFFPNATIYAIDINTDYVNNYYGNNIKTFKCSQDDEKEFNKLFNEIMFDIIIENGSHLTMYQIKSLGILFPYLNDGGLYICENLHTSFRNNFINSKTKPYDMLVEYKKNKKIICSDLNENVIKYLNENISDIKIFERENNAFKCYNCQHFNNENLNNCKYCNSVLDKTDRSITSIIFKNKNIFVNCYDTILTILNYIELKKTGIYLRFGDGDYNLAHNKDDMLAKINPKLMSKMHQSFAINDNDVLFGLPHHCKALNTLEKNMFPGNHENTIENIDKYIKFINSINSVKIYYSSIALCYSASHNPDLVVKLHNQIKKYPVLFIGNKEYTNDFIIKLFGNNINRINTESSNSFNQFDYVFNEFNNLYKNNYINYDYFIIIMASGCSGRAFSGEIYYKYYTKNKNFFILDYGSLLDYLFGLNTRAYMDYDPPQKEYILSNIL